eukprot:Skav229148  [mRNA]  locus=scaffold1875:253429:260764:+ [translate_table: standard]
MALATRDGAAPRRDGDGDSGDPASLRRVPHAARTKAEQPTFVAELPAGKRMGNLIAVCTQVGRNIAPIIYKAATRRRAGNLVVAIGCFQAVAVLSLLATMVLWHSTPILLLCTVLAGSVGLAKQQLCCMSSVTYWAHVAQRPASCVRAMSVGMTLGGLLATGFATLQLGGRKQGQPRFSAEIFFLLAAVMQAGQAAMFVWRSAKSASHGAHVADDTGDHAAAAQPGGCFVQNPLVTEAKFLMAGCFVVYATTYIMPTLMPFMAHVQEITENMGFCGQMGALIANFAAFVAVFT